MENNVYANIKNNGIISGILVQSIAGHDKGTAYLVISCENKISQLVNGYNKTVLIPKKKRVKHIRPIYYPEKPEKIIKELNEVKNENQQNIYIRKVIKEMLNENQKGGVNND